jgi:hypothetical protein
LAPFWLLLRYNLFLKDWFGSYFVTTFGSTFRLLMDLIDLQSVKWKGGFGSTFDFREAKIERLSV